MEANKGLEELRAVIPTGPIVGLENVNDSMADIRKYLPAADMMHVEPFAFVYHEVTRKVADKAYDPGYFDQPHVLPVATGSFHYLYAKQLLDPQPHWQALISDERARHIDLVTQFGLGMTAHIGGDLHQTVDMLSRSPAFNNKEVASYKKRDYPKIHHILADTAEQVAPTLIQMENSKLQRYVVAAAMSGVKIGRSIAMHDANRLIKAKSIDEREAITERAIRRAARLTSNILGVSYAANQDYRKSLGLPIEQPAAVIDLGARGTLKQRTESLIGRTASQLYIRAA